MGDYKPQVGDRVRVTFESEVKQVYGDGDLRFELIRYYDTEIPHEADCCIEKIEPPVEVFGPGDVVRSKGSSGHTYLILEDGWASAGEWPTGRTGVAVRAPQRRFTSEDYERVNL